MAYVDHKFYDDSFGGREIPDDEFTRIADIASDVIFDVCNIKPTEKEEAYAPFKKAVCYQIEMLYEQGGVDAILGFSEDAQKGSSESLGDYSISSQLTNRATVMTSDGIPVSTLAVMLLRRLGLMSRWVYADLYERRCKIHGESKSSD